MNGLIRNVLVASLLISGFLALTGCNTVKGTVSGAEKDVKKVARAVS